MIRKPIYKIYYNKSKINQYSGNNTTLDRLSKILNYPFTSKFTSNIENNIIGIHAYKFGKDIITSNNDIFPKTLNFILITGGTDLNIDINDPNKEPIIRETIIYARYIICFNIFMYNIIVNKYDQYIDINKIKIIPQSVERETNIELTPNSIWDDFIYQRKKTKIFVMVGNIRKVKNPFFLEDIFNKKLKEKGYVLVLIGDIIDDMNENNLSDKWTNNIIHLGPIDKKYLSSVYSQADGLINTSNSEGMAGSILEAMLYGCPVYARDIDGNKAIINHGKNGFLFHEPSDFLDLLYLPTHDITKNAYEYVTEYHNKKEEIERYSDLLNF